MLTGTTEEVVVRHVGCETLDNLLRRLRKWKSEIMKVDLRPRYRHPGGCLRKAEPRE